MMLSAKQCCVLNSGGGAWAFEPLALRLLACLGVEVATVPRRFNYLERADCQWCLKYPTGCGASGHRLVSKMSTEPPNWPRPFIVQEFIHLENPEVHRTHCAKAESFGWVVRRYPEGTRPSPWVAHARGARYVHFGRPPEAAAGKAESAVPPDMKPRDNDFRPAQPWTWSQKPHTHGLDRGALALVCVAC